SYEIGFNNEKWDRRGIAYDVEMWGELNRVTKPGSYVLAFGGTRTLAPHATLLNIDDCRDNGRWPANVILDELAGEILDADAPNVKPSRFFYIAKATPGEKDLGLTGHRKRSSKLLAGLKGEAK